MFKKYFTDIINEKVVTFKKEAPNGHFYLATIELKSAVANKIIKSTKPEKSGYYTFKQDSKGNWVVGNNLWIDLGLDQYIVKG